MSGDVDQLAHWLAPLLSRLEPAQLRRLARDVARDLRAANAATMRAQRTPDGAPWEPRKRPAKPPKKARRTQRGKLRAQAMFTKLRAAKHLRASAQGSAAVVQFVGRAQRIARVHHFGLRDRVMPGGPMYDYPARELLGITPDMQQKISERIIDHLARP